MAKIQDIYDAVDDYGLITSAQAAKLGMSNAEVVQQADKGVSCAWPAASTV